MENEDFLFSIAEPVAIQTPSIRKRQMQK